jgi:hypothetical protein
MQKKSSNREPGDVRNPDEDDDAERRAFRDAMRDIWAAEGRVEILLASPTLRAPAHLPVPPMDYLRPPDQLKTARDDREANKNAPVAKVP